MWKVITIAKGAGEALALMGMIYIMMLSVALYGASQGSTDILYVDWFFAPARWALNFMGYKP